MKRKYESLVGRRGKKKALVAVGHKIIVAAYHIIYKKESYKEPVLHKHANKLRKQIRNYVNRLKELGVEVPTESFAIIKEGRFFTEQLEVSRT